MDDEERRLEVVYELMQIGTLLDASSMTTEDLESLLALYKRIAGLETEWDEFVTYNAVLEAERDALAARLEHARSYLEWALGTCAIMARTDIPFVKVLAILSATPTIDDEDDEAALDARLALTELAQASKVAETRVRRARQQFHEGNLRRTDSEEEEIRQEYRIAEREDRDTHAAWLSAMKEQGREQ